MVLRPAVPVRSGAPSPGSPARGRVLPVEINGKRSGPIAAAGVSSSTTSWRGGTPNDQTSPVNRLMGKLEHWNQTMLQPRRGRGSFTFRGDSYDYEVSRHNTTWLNERAVEVPIARKFIDATPGSMLELGNVLHNYGYSGHVVVDKYEPGEGVLNIDVVDYEPEQRFAAIACISTLEHVGRDEEPRHDEKALAGLSRLRSLLRPEGRLLLTVPIGHNQALDSMIFTGCDVIWEGLLQRNLRTKKGASSWREVSRETCEWHPYNYEQMTAQTLWVACVGPE